MASAGGDDRGGGDGGHGDGDEESSEVHRCTVKVAPFYPNNPSLWFNQLESQFALAKIKTDATKYHYVTGSLDPVYAAEVEDIIKAPPAPNKYIRLKTELTKRLSATREKNVRQLLVHEELGDRKPSQFLRHLQHLAGSGVPDEFIKSIWTSRLPSGMQIIVASQDDISLEKLADLADKVHDIAPPSSQVASAHACNSSCNSEIAALRKEMKAMSTKLDRLQSRSTDTKSQHRGRSQNRGRGRSSSRSQSNYKKFPICWYHSTFGDNANKCVKPCDYSGKGQGNL